jgi:ribonucleoside-diphosphate reductase alpha chain
MWRAIRSAESERSLGLGTLGFHTWLQLNRIPIDSERAKVFNKRLYKEIQKFALKASKKLASERGEPADMLSTGVRNAHLIAIAPNASSSIICGGVSPSIEPLAANGFIQKTRVGSHVVKNPALSEYLTKIGKNTDEVWLSIIKNKGSVEHLDFIPTYEKSVFKTAREISMEAIIELAADRQKYICQAQSLNLFLPPKVTAKELHEIHFSAWKKGLKSLYYLRSSSVKSTNTGEILVAPKEPEVAACELGSECKSCEG